MSEEIRGQEMPDTESLEVMKELGMVEEKKEPEPKPEIDSPKEEKPEEKKEDPKEEIKHEEKNDRKPREPKQIPAWQHEVEKKRMRKEFDEEKTKITESFTNELTTIKSQLEEFSKKGHSEKEVVEKKEELDKDLDALADEYGVDKVFMSKLYNNLASKLSPKLPDDVSAKLSKIDQWEAEKQQQQEDLEYDKSFGSKVDPILKEKFPSLTPVEKEAVREKLKEYYFDEKYINLDTDEIYTLKEKELEGLVSSKIKSGEKGTRGVSRGEKLIDYDNITDDEYAKLPPEEQEKVNDYLEKKSR